MERLAIPKAIENLLKQHLNEPRDDPKEDLARCVVASDGFIPFPDSIECLAAHNLRYLIQPGGGGIDKEVTKAAEKFNICMIFTGERIFFSLKFR